MTAETARDLALIQTRITACTGIRLEGSRRRDLDVAIAAVAEQLALPSPASLAARLCGPRPEPLLLARIASALTVGETYFFRDPKFFAYLEQELLPQWSARSAPRYCWSAGCCTGEEPYTLAIQVDRRRRGGASLEVRIHGTDINDEFVARARRAEYRDWSFRGCPNWVRQRCFESLPGAIYRLRPEIRGLVSFAQGNLMDEDLLARVPICDLILCRNTLIYLEPLHAQRLLERLTALLAPDGCLALSPSESLLARPLPLAPVPGVGGLFRKGAGTARAASHPPRPPAAARPGLPAAAVPPPPAAVPTPLETARELAKAGRTDVAVANLESYLEDAGLPVRARAPALACLARLHADQGRLPPALARCEQALAADPLRPEYHLLQATLLQASGELPAAIAALRRVLYLEPRHMRALIDLGHLLLLQGQAEAARRELAGALTALRQRPPQSLVEDSGGLTAGWLTTHVETLLARSDAG